MRLPPPTTCGTYFGTYGAMPGTGGLPAALQCRRPHRRRPGAADLGLVGQLQDDRLCPEIQAPRRRRHALPDRQSRSGSRDSFTIGQSARLLSFDTGSKLLAGRALNSDSADGRACPAVVSSTQRKRRAGNRPAFLFSDQREAEISRRSRCQRRTKAISTAAVSGASEPCTVFSPTERAKSLRMVALGGIGQVGGAHDFTIPGDAVLALEHLHDHGAGGRELDELAEGATRCMDGVEGLQPEPGSSGCASATMRRPRLVEPR